MDLIRESVRMVLRELIESEATDLIGAGWSIAPHIRTELVLDALGMAVVWRTPKEGETILHSDHGSQYRSCAFGQRIKKAGLLGSMGSVGDCYDNAMMESFWGTLQLEILDRKKWSTRAEIANAIFEWIECWYNPTRRHSSLGMLSPVDYEQLHTPPDHSVDPKPRVSGNGGKLRGSRSPRLASASGPVR